MRIKSNEKKENIISFIESYYEERGASPSVREIESGTGISKSTVQRYLVEMDRDNMLDYRGSERSINTLKTKKHSNDFVSVGLIGNIACGEPNFADENIEEYFRLPSSLIGNGEFYFLRAFGDSMIETGINEGDLVLIKKQDVAKKGDIVVALVGDETTLKRYYPEPEQRRIRLHPENRDMDDIYTNECIVQGVAIKVLKDLI